MPTAYSYIRFSRPEQIRGDSLRRQLELSQRYAEENGLTLDTSLQLEDRGLSAFDGTNIEKGNLGAFLKAIDAGVVSEGSYLLVESLDRLSRAQVTTALQLFLSIISKGITIVTLTDGVVYSQETLASGYANLIISITIMARAYEESAMKSKRLKAAWKNKRDNASNKKLTARCPGWLWLNSNTNEYEFIPDRVDVVKQAIELSRSGVGLAAIARRFNQSGIASFDGGGKGWHSSYILKILSSSALYGDFQPHEVINGKSIPVGDPVENYFPSVIDKNEFLLLKEIRQGRKQGGGPKVDGAPNLLSGIVKCGYCGSSMVLQGRPKRVLKSGVVREDKHYVCDGARRGFGCFAVQWDYRQFEKSFLAYCGELDLANFVSDSLGLDDAPDRTRTLNELLLVKKGEIASCEGKLSKLIEFIEMGNFSSVIAVRISELEAMVFDIKKECADIENKIKIEEVGRKVNAEFLQNIKITLDELYRVDGDKKFLLRSNLAEKIRQVVKEVKVYPAGLLHTQDEIHAMRIDLLKAGFDEATVNDYVDQHMHSEPKRQGRGKRGRYGPRLDSGRFFTIKGKSGGFRVLYPSYDDPTVMIVDTANLGRKGHLMAKKNIN